MAFSLGQRIEESSVDLERVPYLQQLTSLPPVGRPALFVSSTANGLNVDYEIRVSRNLPTDLYLISVGVEGADVETKVRKLRPSLTGVTTESVSFTGQGYGVSFVTNESRRITKVEDIAKVAYRSNVDVRYVSAQSLPPPDFSPSRNRAQNVLHMLGAVASSGEGGLANLFRGTGRVKSDVRSRDSAEQTSRRLLQGAKEEYVSRATGLSVDTFEQHMESEVFPLLEALPDALRSNAEAYRDGLREWGQFQTALLETKEADLSTANVTESSGSEVVNVQTYRVDAANNVEIAAPGYDMHVQSETAQIHSSQRQVDQRRQFIGRDWSETDFQVDYGRQRFRSTDDTLEEQVRYFKLAVADYLDYADFRRIQVGKAERWDADAELTGNFGQFLIDVYDEIEIRAHQSHARLIAEGELVLHSEDNAYLSSSANVSVNAGDEVVINGQVVFINTYSLPPVIPDKREFDLPEMERVEFETHRREGRLPENTTYVSDGNVAQPPNIRGGPE